MKNKKLLAIISLSLSFCFVSGVGYGEIDDELSHIFTVSRMEYLLLKAEVDYMMRNPNSFSDINLRYDPVGYFGLFEKWPVEIDTTRRIVIDIRDNRNVVFNKSGVALLESFKKVLGTVYSYIEYIAEYMSYDVVARFYSIGDIPLGYFSEGEYHLWDE